MKLGTGKIKNGIYKGKRYQIRVSEFNNTIVTEFYLSNNTILEKSTWVSKRDGCKQVRKWRRKGGITPGGRKYYISWSHGGYMLEQGKSINESVKLEPWYNCSVFWETRAGNSIELNRTYRHKSERRNISKSNSNGTSGGVKKGPVRKVTVKQS